MLLPVRTAKNYQTLPDALEVADSLFKKLSNYKLMVFLDYDGTLTPIMPHPDEAIISEAMRNIVNQLSQRVPVIIISGRDKDNIKELLKLPNLYYVGNHGFDIDGPQLAGREIGIEYLPLLHRCFNEIQPKLSKIPGVIFEPKRLTMTIHYRFVDNSNLDHVFAVIHNEVANYPQLKISAGKKVLEIRPNINWNKGKAVEWLAQALGYNQADAFILYLGDDLTDEDAFEILPNNGIGILVGNHDQHTYADYHLKNPAEVGIFLSRLTDNR